MTQTPRANAQLKDALALGEGFTPSVKDAAALLELLAQTDERILHAAEKALEKIPARAAELVLETLPLSVRPLRGRLVDLLGRLAAGGNEPARAALLALVGDADLKARLNAINGLGKLSGPDVEAALLQAFERAERPEVRKRALQSLGTAGGEQALALLKQLTLSESSDLNQVRERAILILERTITRTKPSQIAFDAALPEKSVVTLYCRQGLETMLLDDSRRFGRAHVAKAGQVELVTSKPLSAIYTLRLMVDVAFGLPTSSVDPSTAAAEGLASGTASRLLRALTAGAVRYRLDWAKAGDSEVWALAARLAAAQPEWINDPRQSTWEVVIETGAGETPRVWLKPKRFDDPRFAYRQGYVYASSHPTIAAALAKAAGVKATDVVWDPFVGSGTELVERALLGPAKALYGTDIDPRAIATAEANLAAAKVTARLNVGDAMTFDAVRPTLILSNPPLGLRVHRGEALALLLRFLDHAARIMAPDGRLVWISPSPAKTVEAAERLGLVATWRQAVDMGGFTAEIQRFERQPR